MKLPLCNKHIRKNGEKNVCLFLSFRSIHTEYIESIRNKNRCVRQILESFPQFSMRISHQFRWIINARAHTHKYSKTWILTEKHPLSFVFLHISLCSTTVEFERSCHILYSHPKNSMQSICTYNILCIVVFIIECIDLCVIHSCAYRNMINARKFFFFTCSKFHFHIAAPERKQRVSFGWWAHFQEKHVYICWFTWRQAAESTMWN